MQLQRSNDESDVALNPFESMPIAHLAASADISTASITLITQTATPQYIQSSSAPVAQVSTLSSQPPSAAVSSLNTATFNISNTAAPTSALSSYTTVIVNSTSAAPITTSLSTISTPATTNTSETSITPTSTTTSQSTSSSPSSASSPDISGSDASHHAPFYIAIILGTIVVVGLIATVIAWIVRIRLHARRQRRVPDVPWANHQNDDSLERNRDVTFIGQPVNEIGSNGISSQDAVIPWEPRGDRDVGEPKRSNSYVRGTIGRSARAAEVYADRSSYPTHAENASFPLPVYHAYATQQSQYYQDGDGSLDGHRSISTLGPLHVANIAPGDISAESSPIAPDGVYSQSFERDRNEYDMPTEDRAGTWPRFANTPWILAKGQSSAHRRAGGSGNWERLPVPCESHYAGTTTAGDGSWAASVRSNLNLALNTVLPSGSRPVYGEETDTDILTPRPHQRSYRRFARAGLPDSYSGQSLHSPPRQRDITKTSAPEERGDATEKLSLYKQGLGHSTPRALDSCLTLDSPSAGTSICRMSTYDSHDPLLTRRPQSAMLKPDAGRHTLERDNANSRQLSVRSTTSVYSTASTAPNPMVEAPCLPAFSRQSTMKVDVLHPVNETIEEGSNKAKQTPPSLVTRSSSSDCSFSSYYYNGGA